LWKTFSAARLLRRAGFHFPVMGDPLTAPGKAGPYCASALTAYAWRRIVRSIQMRLLQNYPLAHGRSSQLQLGPRSSGNVIVITIGPALP
jgi:hypothetical protein